MRQHIDGDGDGSMAADDEQRVKKAKFFSLFVVGFLCWNFNVISGVGFAVPHLLSEIPSSENFFMRYPMW